MIKPIPIKKKPIMTDSFLLFKSDRIPVGISKIKTVASKTVPTKTNCNGSS
jgi:hypothetical protein